MSIINQMLKDLEKRTHTPMQFNHDFPPLFHSSGKPSGQYKTAGTVVFLTLIGLALICKFIFSHHEFERTQAQENVFVQPHVVSANRAYPVMMTPLSSTPAMLTAITLQLDKATTSLRLLLNQNTLYQVTVHQPNQLIVLLENARLITSVPPVNTMNSALKNIQMINQPNGNLTIVFTLQEGAELTHLELSSTGKLPELQLDFVWNGRHAASTMQHDNSSDVFQKNGSIVTLRTDLSLNDQYQKALQLSTAGRNRDAMKALTSILIANPEYAPARESLALLLIAQGNMVQASQVIQIGLRQRPFYPAYIQLKARILVDEGKINKALYLLQMAPPLLTANPDYHAFIAALYQRQGHSLLAEKLYEQLLAVQPNNGKWWMGLGIALENMGKPTLAMEAYVKASASDYLSPELKIYAESRVHTLQLLKGE